MGTAIWNHGVFEVAYLDNADFLGLACFTWYRLGHDKGPVHKLRRYLEKKRLDGNRSLAVEPRGASIGESKTIVMRYSCVPSKYLIGLPSP